LGVGELAIGGIIRMIVKK